MRASTAAALERFGLDEYADRVTFFSETSVLLDILIGDEDATGREAFFRRAGQNEVRSGNRFIKSYITGPIASWYNLRLIPETEGGNIDSGSVQRVSVFFGDGDLGMQHFTRRARGWEVSGIVVENPNYNNIEMFVRDVINAEGLNFADDVYITDPLFNHSRVVVEFGTGRVVTIRFSESNEEGFRLAHVIGRDIVYSVPLWTVNRIFRDAFSFETQ